MTKKKILIVDDEVALAKMIKMNLEGTGQFEVRVEHKGSQGLETARDFRPDLVFLDIVMPDRAGSDVARDLKNDPDTAGIPIVFLTAILSKEEKENMGELIGGHPFLAKPVSAREIVDCIHKVLKSSA